MLCDVFWPQRRCAQVHWRAHTIGVFHLASHLANPARSFCNCDIGCANALACLGDEVLRLDRGAADLPDLHHVSLDCVGDDDF